MLIDIILSRFSCEKIFISNSFPFQKILIFFLLTETIAINSFLAEIERSLFGENKNFKNSYYVRRWNEQK